MFKPENFQNQQNGNIALKLLALWSVPSNIGKEFSSVCSRGEEFGMFKRTPPIGQFTFLAVASTFDHFGHGFLQQFLRFNNDSISFQKAQNAVKLILFHWMIECHRTFQKDVLQNGWQFDFLGALEYT